MTERWKSLAEHLVVATIFTVLLFLMHPGCFSGLSSGYIGGARGDAGIYIYLERVNASRFFSFASHGFDLPVFYPYKRALAYSDNFLLPALIAKGLFLVCDSEPLVYNTIILAALVMNGFCMYLLALHVTQSRGAALFAGFIFLSCPFFAFHRGHPQLQFAFWIPLTLLASLRYFDDRSFIRASLIGGTVVGAFFCSVYYAMYCYLLAGITLGFLAVARLPRLTLKEIVLFCAGNSIWLALLAPAMGPYMEVRSSFGTNPMAILRMHSPTLSSFAAAPAIEELWSPITRHLSRMEGYLFFGFTPLLLALFVAAEHLVLLCRERSPVRWLGWGMLAVVLLGLIRGTYFSLYTGARTAHHLAWVQSETLWILLSGILVTTFLRRTSNADSRREMFDTIPIFLFLAVFFVFATLGIHDGGKVRQTAPELYRLIMELPGFNALRGLARMGIVVIMLASLLAATAVARLRKVSFCSTRRRYTALCLSLMGLSAIELHTRVVPLAAEIPAPSVYSSVAELPADAPIVALPIGSFARDGRSSMIWNSLYALWTKEYRNPLVNGFSGKVPPFQATASHVLDSFPSREALSTLGTLVGLRYVITNHRHFGEKKARRIRAVAKTLPDQIREISCDGKGSCLFEVNPIIATDTLPATNLLIPWAEGPRTIALQIKGAVKSPRESYLVTLSVVSRGHAVRPAEVIEVPNNGEWQRVKIDIPEVKERVTPLVVSVTTQDRVPLLLRSIIVAQPQEVFNSTGSG